MNYDAVSVGPNDLAAGIDFLKTKSPSGFPWISANIHDNNQNTIFPPFQIRQIGNTQVGITGFTGKLPTGDRNIHISPWREVLPDLLKSLTEKCDVIILLSSLSKKDNEDIAHQFPEVNILISAYPKTGNQIPRIVNNTLLTQTNRQGKYLGLLTSQIGNSGKWEEDLQLNYEKLGKRLTSLEHQLKRVEARENEHSPRKAKILARIEKQRKDILQQQKELKEKIDLKNSQGQTDSSFSVRFLAMKSSLPEDKNVNAIVSNIKKQINALNRSRSKKGLSDDAKLQKIIGKLAGYNKCQPCHETQTKFWESTNHFNSYSTLLKKGQAYNLDCLPCHVTHQSDPSNPVTVNREMLLSLPSSFLVVGCESCHGPGLAHADNPESIKPHKQPYEAVCITCHTTERDDHFQFEEKLMKAGCPSG